MHRAVTQENNVLPLNVVVLGNFSYPEGMAGTRRIQFFLDYLVAHGNSAQVLCLRQGERRLRRDQVCGQHRNVPFVTVGHRLRPTWSALLWSGPFLVQGLVALKRMVRRHHHNVLLVYKNPNIENIAMLWWALKLGFRVVFDLTEDETAFREAQHRFARIKQASIRRLDRHLSHWAHGVIVVSPTLETIYRERLDRDIPVQLIPISAQVPNRAENEPFHSPLRIAYAGSYAPKDDVPRLVQAFLQFHEQFPSSTLWLMGLGQGKVSLMQELDPHPAIQCIEFLPENAYFEKLAQADILCMTRADSPFAAAGFPFKLGEYLASGRPVLASRVGDVPKFVQHQREAYLLEPGNTQALVQGLIHLATHEAQALDMGRAGRACAETHFNPQKNGQMLLEFLRSI